MIYWGRRAGVIKPIIAPFSFHLFRNLSSPPPWNLWNSGNLHLVSQSNNSLLGACSHLWFSSVPIIIIIDRLHFSPHIYNFVPSSNLLTYQLSNSKYGLYIAIHRGPQYSLASESACLFCVKFGPDIVTCSVLQLTVEAVDVCSVDKWFQWVAN